MKTLGDLKFWLRIKRGEYIAAKDISLREGGSATEHRAIVAFIGEVLGKIEELEREGGRDGRTDLSHLWRRDKYNW